MDAAPSSDHPPESDLHTIVYFSWSTLRNSDDDPALEIARILASANRNNPPRGITGALLFSQGCFAQVLEGPRDAVEACFAQLQADPRHHGVIRIMSAPLAQRRFPAWAMAYAGEDTAHDPPIDITGALANPTQVDANAAGRDLVTTLMAAISLHEPA